MVATRGQKRKHIDSECESSSSTPSSPRPVAVQSQSSEEVEDSEIGTGDSIFDSLFFNRSDDELRKMMTSERRKCRTDGTVSKYEAAGREFKNWVKAHRIDLPCCEAIIDNNDELEEEGGVVDFNGELILENEVEVRLNWEALQTQMHDDLNAFFVFTKYKQMASHEKKNPVCKLSKRWELGYVTN